MSKEFLEFISIALSAILLILGWLYNRRTEEIKIMRAQLSERKHKAYADCIGTFYSILKDSKANHQTNLNKVGSQMIDAKRDIFMYGSDEVFKAFNNWLLNVSSPRQLEFYLKFILSIRKDICGKTKLKEEDILLNLFQDPAEVEKFKEKIKT